MKKALQLSLLGFALVATLALALNWHSVARVMARAGGSKGAAAVSLALSQNDWLVFVGDSRTDPGGDVGPGPTGTWEYQLMHSDPSFASTQVYNFARNSFTTANALGQFTAGAYGRNTAGSVYIFVWIGVNDIYTNVPPATAYENLKTMWADSRALGYKVVAFTSGPGCGTTAAQDQIAALDKLIMSDSSLYDYLVRPETILPIHPCQDTNHTYFVDGVHPNKDGNALIAAAIDALLNPSTNPNPTASQCIQAYSTPSSKPIRLWFSDDATLHDDLGTCPH